jgi:ABC-2 type transport system ATP-binding protein
MHEMYDDIVEFAELEEFMDLKLKNYSSGMQVRLAFSIAIKSKSPILVFDEVLAVGDASFQAKCLRQFAEFKKSGRTIVLVTHDMNTVEKFCDRVVLLNDSLVAYDGGFAKAIELYNSLNVLGSSDDNEIDKHSKSPAWIKSVTVNSKKNSPKGVVEPLVPFSISIQIQASKEIKSAFLAVKVCESESQKIVFGFDSKADNHKLPLKLGNNKVVIDIDKSTFVSGKYYVVAGLYNNSGREIIYSHYNGLERGSMFMVGSGLDDGLISVDHTWRSK